MARTHLPSTVAQRVSDAIVRGGVPVSYVAEAADLTIPEFKARLIGDVDFNTQELVRVGGFLHIRPSAFLNGAVA